MAKTKQTPVKQEQLITLTQEQFEKLNEINSLLDTASDSLDGIDGGGNLFEIGKAVGDATSDIVKAFNDLDNIIDQLNEQVNGDVIEDLDGN